MGGVPPVPTGGVPPVLTGGVPPPPTGGVPPTINAGGAGKIETRPDATAGTGGGPGAAFAPPGFEDARKKFLDALKTPKK